MLSSATLLNPVLLKALAGAGHGQLIAIADAGLPLPAGVPIVDLSVTAGLPAFADVVRAVIADGVFEGYVVAEESAGTAPFVQLEGVLAALPATVVDHESLKRRLAEARVIVRTGECTPFANIVLIAGTTF